MAAGVLLAVLALPGAAWADAPDPGARIVLEHRPGLSAAERTDLRQDAGVAFSHRVGPPRIEVVEAEGPRAAALEELQADPGVVWAQADRRVSIAAEDPGLPLQTGLRNLGGPDAVADADIDATEAWPLTRGAGVTVGVVDTGVQTDHPDLDAQLVPGEDFLWDGDGTVGDENGHGTHVAGTVAAERNGEGVVGVASEATVMPFRALEADGRGWASDVAQALYAAGEEGLPVVNASLGAYFDEPAQRAAIASHPGTLYVVAAGNDDRDAGGFFPCALGYANVLCVGASDAADRPSGFSNSSATSVDLHAPGERIVSTYLDGGYAYRDGTSMAAPHVAGAAALLLAQHPGWTPAQVKAALLDSADPRPDLQGRSVTGGRLNAASALGVTPDALAPSAPAALRAEPGTGEVVLRWTPAPDADVAGYRVWWQAMDGAWKVAGTTTGPAARLVEGPAAAARRFRVAAFDGTGNASPFSPTASTVAEPGPGPVPAPAPAPVPVTPPAVPVSSPDRTPAVTPVRRGTPTVARVTRLAVTGRPRKVRFRLSGAATVRITVAVRSRGRWRTVTRSLAALRAGAHAVPAGRTATRGAWRATVAVTGGRAVSASFRIR